MQKSFHDVFKVRRVAERCNTLSDVGVCYVTLRCVTTYLRNTTV